MSSTPPTWVDITLGGLAALGTAVVGWFTGKRNNAGTIDTSDAQVVWDATWKLKDDFAEEVERLHVQVGLLEKEVQGSRDETREARRETSEARAETRSALAEADTLRNAARDASEEVFKLRRQLQLAQAELEDIHRERLKGQPDV